MLSVMSAVHQECKFSDYVTQTGRMEVVMLRFVRKVRHYLAKIGKNFFKYAVGKGPVNRGRGELLQTGGGTMIFMQEKSKRGFA